jgi:hypothetical protein
MFPSMCFCRNSAMLVSSRPTAILQVQTWSRDTAVPQLNIEANWHSRNHNVLKVQCEITFHLFQQRWFP